MVDAWSAVGDMNGQRYVHTATLLPSGKVLLAGGAWTDVGALASTELYSDLPDPSRGNGAQSFSDRQVLQG